MKANKIIYFLEKDQKGKWKGNHGLAVYAETQDDLWEQVKQFQKGTNRKMMGIANCTADYNHNTLIG